MIKATDRKLVVGLEIGTAKVAALVGEVLPDGMINIIGVGSCPSRGMDKGGVNDLESVVKCVQRAIDQAELMADCQISSVYLALSGKHISCQNEIGMVPISEEEVTQDDVAGWMAIGIVDHLEVIEVAHDHRQPGRVTRGTFDFLFEQVFFHVAPVVAAGQVVAEAEVTQDGLRAELAAPETLVAVRGDDADGVD